MADEPSDEPVAHATAHECNGDREGLACRPLSDSGASISDGATEIIFEGDLWTEAGFEVARSC